MTKNLSQLCLTLAVFTSSHALANNFNSEKTEQLVSWLQLGKTSEIEQAIANGVNINHAIPGDGTPLMLAVGSGHNQLVYRLVELGADVNQSSIQDGNPLIVAAANNRLELVEYLVEAGADLDAIVKHDETALITASRAGHLEMVKLLVTLGADVNLAVEAETIGGVEIRSPLNGARNEDIRLYLKQQGAYEL